MRTNGDASWKCKSGGVAEERSDKTPDKEAFYDNFWIYGSIVMAVVVSLTLSLTHVVWEVRNEGKTRGDVIKTPTSTQTVTPPVPANVPPSPSGGAGEEQQNPAYDVNNETPGFEGN